MNIQTPLTIFRHKKVVSGILYASLYIDTLGKVWRHGASNEDAKSTSPSPSPAKHF